MGTQADCITFPSTAYSLPIHHRGIVQDVRRQSARSLLRPHLRRRGSDVPLPGLLLDCMDPIALAIPTRGDELFNSCQWPCLVILRPKWLRVSLATVLQGSLTEDNRLVFVFIMPIGLENIGWKMYMVNGSWDIITLVLIVSQKRPPSLLSVAKNYSGRFLGGNKG